MSGRTPGKDPQGQYERINPTHVVWFRSQLNPDEHRAIYIVADDDQHAWQQAGWRLGGLDSVVSVKPYREFPDL